MSVSNIWLDIKATIFDLIPNRFLFTVNASCLGYNVMVLQNNHQKPFIKLFIFNCRKHIKTYVYLCISIKFFNFPGAYMAAIITLVQYIHCNSTNQAQNVSQQNQRNGNKD